MKGLSQPRANRLRQQPLPGNKTITIHNINAPVFPNKPSDMLFLACVHACTRACLGHCHEHYMQKHY